MSTGARLRLARLAASRSLEDVAAAAQMPALLLEGVETGAADAPPELLWSLSRALSIDLPFLLRTDPVLDLATASPTLGKLTAPEQRCVYAQAVIAIERALDVESYLPLENTIAFAYPTGFPIRIGSAREAAEAGDQLRAAWGLGAHPIARMTDLLEGVGIKLAAVNAPDQFDACAFRSDDALRMPVIAVGRSMLRDAQRFALARELAYLLLDGVTPQTAGHFAAALLIPVDALRRTLGEARSDLHPYELHLLRQTYGATTREIIARAASLRIISKPLYEALLARIRNEAPSSDSAEEPARVLHLILRLLVEQQIDIDEAAELAGESAEQWAARSLSEPEHSGRPPQLEAQPSEK